MGKDNKMFDDLAKVTTSALGGIFGIKHQIKDFINHKIEEYLSSMQLVKREEHEVLKAMLISVKVENQKLLERMENFESKTKAN